MKLSFHKKQYSTPKHPQDPLMRRIWSDPYFDWPFLVILVTVLAGIYIGIGFLTYTDIRARITAPQTPFATDRSQLFNAEALSVLLEDFDARARENAEVKKGYVRVADPSL
jgi:hypothetical protein